MEGNPQLRQTKWQIGKLTIEYVKDERSSRQLEMTLCNGNVYTVFTIGIGARREQKLKLVSQIER